jgi:hypothetical protein
MRVKNFMWAVTRTMTSTFIGLIVHRSNCSSDGYVKHVLEAILSNIDNFDFVQPE